MRGERVERGIRKLANETYEVRVHVARDPLTGRLQQVSRTVHGGIRAARNMRAQLETEVTKGEHGGTKATLGYLFDAWNLHREKLGKSPTTLYEDRRKIDRNIRPALGSKRLDKLGPRDLDNFYGDELQRGVSAQTVLHEHRIIHAALERGVAWGWLDSNVADHVEPPRPRPREATVPVGSEVQALIREALKSRNKEMAGVITVGALGGLRDGELCGLRLCDGNWDDDSITIRRSVWQAGNGWGVKDQKSHTAEPKPLALDQLAMGVLRYRLQELEAAAEAAGVELSPEAYVWSRDPLGATPYLPKSVSQAYRRIRDRVGIRARLHDLRHFAGTEMVARGVDIRTVSERMRHSDPAFTLRTYVTGRPELSRAAAAELGKALMPPESDQAAR